MTRFTLPLGALMVTVLAGGALLNKPAAQTLTAKEVFTAKVDPAGGSGTVETCEFSPDGLLFAAGNASLEARIYKVSDGSLVRTIKHKPGAASTKELGEVESVYFSPDGTLLATTGNKTGIRIFKVADGTLVKELSATGTSDGAAFSPDGKLYACQAGVYETANWTKVLLSLGHSCDVNSFDFSKDSKLMVSGSCDQKIIVRSTTDWSLVTKISCGAGIKSVRISPDGKTVLSGHSHPALARVYTFPDLKLVKQVYTSPDDGVMEAVAWASDGKFLFHGLASGPVTIVRASDWAKVGTLSIRCEYIDVHKNLMIAGGEEGIVKLWRLEGGSTSSVMERVGAVRSTRAPTAELWGINPNRNSRLEGIPGMGLDGRRNRQAKAPQTLVASRIDR